MDYRARITRRYAHGRREKPQCVRTAGDNAQPGHLASRFGNCERGLLEFEACTDCATSCVTLYDHTAAGSTISGPTERPCCGPFSRWESSCLCCPAGPHPADLSPG